MTESSSVYGSFVDVKIVRTRSVVQLVIEVPIERADYTLRELGGIPQPGTERPVAVAPLDPNVARGTTRDQAHGATSGVSPPVPDDPPAPGATHRKPWQELSCAQQAGIRCHDKRFWRQIAVRDADEAAEWIRRACEVKSRAELDGNDNANIKWRMIDAAFQAACEGEGREDWL